MNNLNLSFSIQITHKLKIFNFMLNTKQKEVRSQKKEAKPSKKIIRTCIHSPFEFNMRTLDQNRSAELAHKILDIQPFVHVKCGIKSAIRKLRQQ